MKIGTTEIIIGAILLYLLTQKKTAFNPATGPQVLPYPQKQPGLPAITQSIYGYGTAGMAGFEQPVKDVSTYTQRVAGITSQEIPARFKNLERGWESDSVLVSYNGYDITPFNPITRKINFNL